MLAKQWLKHTQDVMLAIENSQMENIQKAATIMAGAMGPYIRMRPRDTSG